VIEKFSLHGVDINFEIDEPYCDYGEVGFTEWNNERKQSMVSVKVIREQNGKPEKGAKVALGFDGLFSGGITSDECTDSNGDAHFEVDPGRGKVYINGSTKYEGHLSGRIVVYI